MSEREEVERWFLRQGLPHLIDGYRASTDVFTRALPFLLAVFLFNIVGAYSDRFTGWAQALVAGISFAIVLGAAVGVNLLRRRRPFQRPSEVGSIELAVFALAPALPPLLFGTRPLLTALGIVAGNLVVLVGVYVVVGFGLVPTTIWAARQTYRHLSQVLTLMGRALPFVLVFSAFLFLNAELWQVALDFTAPAFWVTVGLLSGVAVVFVALRIPREIAQISHFDSWVEVHELAAGAESPLVTRQVQDLRGDHDPPLSKPDRFNVGLVVLFNLGLQIVLVSIVIGLFYVAFGVFAVREDTIITWTSLDQLGPDEVIARWELWGTDFVLTVVLLRVVGFLVAFSALQFALAAVTDATYRQEFFDEVTGEVRHALAVRSIYLDQIVDEPTADHPVADG
ncbi:MAG: hypothetical protein OEV40_02400 [Acidimicrobiia bacterium]|nr:hypothetical protein [Acidimicrobiia bacterium]